MRLNEHLKKVNSKYLGILACLTMKLVMFSLPVVGGTVVVAMLSYVMEDLLTYYMYAESARPL
jgi:hypothetical protein